MDLRFAICDLRLREKGPHARRRCSSPATSNQQPATSAFRPGFSFTEILFAVMILGIGFIMVAAMFPVAIKQTAATGEETTAAAIAKSGADYLERIASNATMPPALAPPPPTAPTLPPAAVVVAGNPFWAAASGNLILPSDTRYAWVPFYRRDNTNFAQVIVIGTQVRNRSTYDKSDYIQFGMPGFANLQAKPVMVTLTDGSTSNPPGPDLIQFAPLSATPPAPAAPNSPDFTGFVAEGCYVVIANDPGVVIPATPNPGNTPPQVLHTANGYIYRVGNARPDLNLTPPAWELMPGNDMKGASYKPLAAGGQVLAYIVGRGYTDPGTVPATRTPDTTPTGAAMDIAAYTTFVRVN